MQGWVWIVGIGLLAWLGFQLWRAATLGKISAGVTDYSRSDGPFWFWFQVAMFTLAFLLFAGGLIAAVARTFGAI